MHHLLLRLRQSSKTVPGYLHRALLQPCTDRIAGTRDVKTQANRVKVGNIIEVDGKLVEIIKSVHGAGQARQVGNVQMELRDVTSKRKYNMRFHPADMVERVRLRTKEYQVLYAEGDKIHMMDDEYEQIEVDSQIFGDQAKWLVDGLAVNVDHLDSGEPLSGELPKVITAEVEEAEEMMRGDSATNSQMKSCTLKGGAQIRVPGHINAGQKIVVNTEDGTFIRRAS